MICNSFIPPEVLIFFNTTPKHNDTFSPPSQELHHNHTSLSTGSGFQQGKHSSPIKTELPCKLLHKTKFLMSWPLCKNISNEQHLAEWLLHHQFHVFPLQALLSTRKKMFHNIKVTGWTFLIDHASPC